MKKKELESKSKREELARLEAQIASEKQFNWTPLISLGIVFTIVITLSAYLLVKDKIKKKQKFTG